MGLIVKITMPGMGVRRYFATDLRLGDGYVDIETPREPKRRVLLPPGSVVTVKERG